MPTVAVHPPKTPVTKGSGGVAAANLPNICKMPPPPPPFAPTPLPNIGTSGKDCQGYSKSVKIEGNPIAITGSSFGSSGDIASKATGGGLISNNAEGPTKFITPGEITVRIQSKFTQYLGDLMMNNCGIPGAPANSATMNGEMQSPLPAIQVLTDIAKHCDETTSPTTVDGKKKSCLKLGEDKHSCCEDKIQEHRNKTPPDGSPKIEGEKGYKRPALDDDLKPIKVDGEVPAPIPTNAPRPNLAAAFKQGGSAIKAAFAALKGNCYPDAASLNADGSKTFYDFKFKCPPGHPSGKGVSKPGGKKPSMSPFQNASYSALGKGSGNGMAIAICP
ncbi:MAG TPA: PAAR-like domain-containing protein [Polyangiales bacterium]|nr:PAAR-like domain-containing protein [Polyangiales bacterium]